MSPISATAASTKALPGELLCRGRGRDRGASRTRSARVRPRSSCRTTCWLSPGASCSSTSTMRSTRCPGGRCWRSSTSGIIAGSSRPRSAKGWLLERAGIEPAKVGPVPPRLLPRCSARPTGCSTASSSSVEGRREGALVDGRRSRSGRKTEVDYLNGELVRLAERLHTRRRSAGRSSSWSTRPKPARSRLIHVSRCAKPRSAVSGRLPLRQRHRRLPPEQPRLGPWSRSTRGRDCRREHDQADDHHRGE